MDRGDGGRALATAARQHGLIRVRDLACFGIGRTQARRLIAKGIFTPVRPGVVLIGGGEPSDWQRAVAAWMMAGPEAALSHFTAAKVHRLACAPRSESVEISIPRSSRRTLSDSSVHRVQWEDDDVVVRGGVRVTSPIRTLIDVAPSLHRAALEKVVDEGLIADLWDIDTLECRRPGRHEIAAGRRPEVEGRT